MFKKFHAILLSCLLVFLPGCSALSPQQRSGAAQTIEIEYQAGNITKAQHDAAIEALANDQPFDWSILGIVGANIALALIGGPMIVRVQRGQPTQKVGLPASLVRQEPIPTPA